MTNIDLCYKVEKNRPQPKSETNHHHKEHIQISGKLLEPTPPHPPCDLHIPRGLSGFFNVHFFVYVGPRPLRCIASYKEAKTAILSDCCLIMGVLNVEEKLRHRVRVAEHDPQDDG